MNKYLVLIGSLTISACSGGGDGSPNSQHTNYKATGKVIDGYVVGATVFLDINGNGRLDVGDEPSTVSTDEGEYELELTEKQSQCLGVSPTIVDVPVGAIDVDEGVVTEAYQMVLPPAFEDKIDFDNRFITPLTSSLWGNVIKNKTEIHTCDDLLKDLDKKYQLAQALEHSITAMVRTYNISEENIYDDFIASGNNELLLKAQSIVKGLQQSYRDTVALQEKNPNSYVRVQYYFREIDETKHWFKKVFISELGPDATATQKESRVSDDLSTEIETIFESNSVHSGTDWGSYSQSFYVVGGSVTDYGYPRGCTFNESLRIKDDMFDYELNNQARDKDVYNLVNCQSLDLTNKLESRSTTTFEYNKSKSDVVMRIPIKWNTHTFDNDFDFGLPTVINVKDRLNSLDVESIRSNIKGRFKPYTSDDLDNASEVTRTKVVKSGENEVTYWKNISNTKETSYTRITTYPDQTSLTEVSTDGQTWSKIK